MKNVKIHTLIFFCVLCWGASYVAIKIGLEGFDPTQLAAYRFSIAGFFLLPVVLFRKMQIPTKVEFLQILSIAVAGIFCYQIALNYSTIHFHPNHVSFVANSAPIFIALLSGLFLQERTTWIGWTGLAIGLTGIWILNAGQNPVHISDYLILLVIPVCSAVFFILQKPLLRRLKPIEVMTYAILLGAGLLALNDHSFLFEIPKAPIRANLAAVYLGILPTAIAFNVWTYILSKIDASYAAIFIYFIPLVTIFLSALILGQMPGAQVLIGGTVVLTGVYISTRKSFFISSNPNVNPKHSQCHT